MMACKAWLFETMTFQLRSRDSMTLWDSERTKKKRHLFDASQPPTKADEVAFYSSCFMRILRETDPVKQKRIGREIPNFNQTTWNIASKEIVTAGLIARAEADSRLGSIYEENRVARKRFVEANPRDSTWGVGLSFSDRAVEDSRRWRGENRLGNCHGRACAEYLERNRS